ncbi:hypothetical protein [PinkBerry-associated phage LS06-2018-MD08]|nr:hypothetical protein [PinkBerry-associated phage LS06-2018-MD08]
MNKAIMLSVQPKWLSMILDGTKEYEFRGNNVKNFVDGMKIYFYESLGKKSATIENIKINGYTRNEFDKTIIYQGSGKVVGEAVIEDIYEPSYNEKWNKFDINEFLKDERKGKFNLLYNFAPNLFITNPKLLSKKDYIDGFEKTKSKLRSIGYDEQKYAIKLKDVVKYDEPIDKEEFAFYNKWINSSIYKETSKRAFYGNYDYETEMSNALLENYHKFEVTKAPQSFAYVVEREEL